MAGLQNALHQLVLSLHHTSGPTYLAVPPVTRCIVLMLVVLSQKEGKKDSSY